jgi:hypothetical protein
MRVLRQIQRAGAQADALITGVARRYRLSHAALDALTAANAALDAAPHDLPPPAGRPPYPTPPAAHLTPAIRT